MRTDTLPYSFPQSVSRETREEKKSRGVEENDKEKYLDGYQFLYIYTWQCQSSFLNINKKQEFKFHKEQKMYEKLKEWDYSLRT